MTRRRIALFLGLGLCVAPGCENVPSWGTDRTEPVAQEPTDFGPTAAYERRLIFVGPGQRLPTAAIVDFVSLSDSVGLRRGVRVRVADGDEWSRLLDLGWEGDPMREPWTLVPHGPLRLVAGDAGDLAAVVFRGDVEMRLEPGAPLAEYSVDRGTHLVLRQGRLSLGADLVHGLLLDAQLGRRLDPAVSRDGPAEDALETDAEGDATPSARPGAEALLLDNAGYYLVFATSTSGQIGWSHHDGHDVVRRGARLVAASWQEAGDNVQVPNAWRIAGPGELTGELVAELVDGVEIGRAAEVERLGYAIVSGWVDDGDVRREVFGIVRHAR